MSFKLIDKMKLLMRLKLLRDNVKIDNYNEHTYDWSKGRIFGIGEVIEEIEKYEEEKE